MPDIWQSIVTAAQAMTWLEVVATIFSAVCVFLAVKRKVINYPIGIVGTIAFFFVFWNIGLYSSAMLQIFFTAVQVYGWWFWLKGNKGEKPRISRVNRAWTLGGIAAAIVGGVGLSLITGAFGAKMAVWDALIFGLSVVAQFFLDRKKLENWIVWIGVNVISIGVYASQGLALTSILYMVFLVNAFYGYYEWWKEFRGYRVADQAADDVKAFSQVNTFGGHEGVVLRMIDREPTSTSIFKLKEEVTVDEIVAPAAKPKRKRAAKPKETVAKPDSITPTLTKPRAPRKPKTPKE